MIKYRIKTALQHITKMLNIIAFQNIVECYIAPYAVTVSQIKSQTYLKTLLSILEVHCIAVDNSKNKYNKSHPNTAWQQVEMKFVS